MNSKQPITQCTRLPSFAGITPLAMETTERYLKMHNQIERSKPSCLKLVCFVLLTITAFNTLYTSMTIYKNAMLIQENRDLIERILVLEMHNYVISGSSMLKSFKVAPTNSDAESVDTLKLAKMIDVRSRAECPPCTTPKPTPIAPHKNPVSILNEEIGNGKAIIYTCQYNCLNPTIHTSYLIINSTELEGKEWVGTGDSKAKAKQVAAYLAIKDVYPELESTIGQEHCPVMDYHPICNTPSPETDRVEGGTKC